MKTARKSMEFNAAQIRKWQEFELSESEDLAIPKFQGKKSTGKKTSSHRRTSSRRSTSPKKIQEDLTIPTFKGKRKSNSKKSGNKKIPQEELVISKFKGKRKSNSKKSNKVKTKSQSDDFPAIPKAYSDESQVSAKSRRQMQYKADEIRKWQEFQARKSNKTKAVTRKSHEGVSSTINNPYRQDVSQSFVYYVTLSITSALSILTKVFLGIEYLRSLCSNLSLTPGLVPFEQHPEGTATTTTTRGILRNPIPVAEVAPPTPPTEIAVRNGSAFQTPSALHDKLMAKYGHAVMERVASHRDLVQDDNDDCDEAYGEDVARPKYNRMDSIQITRRRRFSRNKKNRASWMTGSRGVPAWLKKIQQQDGSTPSSKSRNQRRRWSS